MCGRFGLFADLSELMELLGFEIGLATDSYEPRWNIAPTADVLVIIDIGRWTRRVNDALGIDTSVGQAGERVWQADVQYEVGGSG